MNSEQWIKKQSPFIQDEIFKRISHFLSNRELQSIMQDIQRGKSLLMAHSKMNLFEKYQIDIYRSIDIVKEKYPDMIF